MRREVFEIWADPAQDRWTRYVKPALFVHPDMPAPSFSIFSTPFLPGAIKASNDVSTAFIIDLPGEESVGAGVALAKERVVPIPLFNGIHETKLGSAEPAVDNAPIITALAEGSSVLKNIRFMSIAPPAFLLDANRDKPEPEVFGKYDNRWELEASDMPDAAYLQAMGIMRLVLWQQTDMVAQDLVPILDTYARAGIEVLILAGQRGELVSYQVSLMPVDATGAANPAPQADEHLVVAATHFEYMRQGLFLIALMAVVNLLFMFSPRVAPILYTTPTIMWLTYLWVPEGVGDLIAILSTIGYVGLYFMTSKHRHWMNIAMGIFAAEVVILFVYALWYGVWAYMGHAAEYGLLVFGFPVMLSIFFIVHHKNGVVGQVADLGEQVYDTLLQVADQRKHGGDAGLYLRPHRHFRGFRGYGGSGHGGYRGGGYSGRYGGGFGG